MRHNKMKDRFLATAKVAAFKEAYNQSTTAKDADEVIKMLTIGERNTLMNAMEKVNEYMGIDMKQAYYLRVMKAIYDIEAEELTKKLEKDLRN